MHGTALPRGTILPIERIDPEDRHFALTPPWQLEDSRLTRAIHRVGIQQPLLLQAVGSGRFRIVAGFKRHHAARALGLATLPVFLAENESDVDLLLRALCENIGVRPLGPIEEAEAAARLKAFGLKPESLLEEVLPLLGIPASRHHLERLLAIAALPDALKKAITGRLRVDLALALAVWRPDELDLFIGLVDALQLGANKQREIFDLLDELRRPGGDDVVHIWRSSGAAARAGDQDASPNQRFAAVKAALLRLRFPTLSEYESRFENLRRELNLPSNIRLEAPPFFEGTRIRFDLSAGSVEDLKASVRRLGDATEKPAMRKIFDLL